eukprot:s9674_g2.t1
MAEVVLLRLVLRGQGWFGIYNQQQLGLHKQARGQLLNFVELMGWAKLREVCSATPSTRPATPSTPAPALMDGRVPTQTGGDSASRWSDGERRAPPHQMMGDNGQVASMYLQDSDPEVGPDSE